MSDGDQAPGGLSWSGFKAVSLEVGSWVWGTAQGAFNEKATVGQIITDAVIGVIPVVGDGTAVRDLIAVVIGMIDEEKKREDKLQWVLLVVLLLALIPVAGGVAKGVGRLTLQAVGEAAHLASEAERVVYMGKAAKDFIAFLNHLHIGNAEKWLLEFKFSKYLPEVTQAFNRVMITLDRVLTWIPRNMARVLPDSALRRLEGLKKGIAFLREKADKMIPDAVKELDRQLKEIQAYIRSGGQTTSRTAAHTVTAGDAASHTLTDEARLIGGEGAVRTPQGGWEQNPARSTPKDLKEISKKYTNKDGFPDLFENTEKIPFTDKVKYTFIASYSGSIVNRTLNEGETVFRVFGPKGTTHGFEVGMSSAAGNPTRKARFFGIGAEPKTAEEWRMTSAVIDEWNHDMYIIVGKVKKSGEIKACTGKIAEQVGRDIPGQYLPGGSHQAMFEMTAADVEKLNKVADEVIKTGISSEPLLVGDIEYIIRPTGWKDANGVWGYSVLPGPGTVAVTREGVREERRSHDQ